MSTRPQLSLAQLSIFTLISAVLWYFALAIDDSLGWLVWIAPLPLLLIAFQSKWWQALLCTFIAYLIGRLSWFPFLSKVLPGFVAIIITILSPIVYSLS